VRLPKRSIAVSHLCFSVTFFTDDTQTPGRYTLPARLTNLPLASSINRLLELPDLIVLGSPLTSKLKVSPGTDKVLVTPLSATNVGLYNLPWNTALTNWALPESPVPSGLARKVNPCLTPPGKVM
jgi:hypothetical protein